MFISKYLNNIKKLNYLIYLFMFIFLCQKLLLATFLYDTSNIIDLGFGMGGYVEGLKNDLIFQNCNAVNLCNYSSRMPGVPIIIFLFTFFSDTQIGVSIVKSISYSLICFLILLLILKENFGDMFKINILQTYLGTYFVMIMMLPLSKHSTSIIYEEGYFFELLIPWIVINSILIRRITHNELFNFDKLNSLNLLLGFMFFMIKSSMIVLFFWSTLLLFIICRIKSKNILGKFSISSLIFCFFVTFLWIAHNFNSGGGLKIMSSWDGENLFRGNNSVSAKIYPDISLDRLTDTEKVTLRSGEVVEFTTFPHRKEFENEWEWSSYYKNKSFEWFKEDHAAWVNFMLTKSFNFFLSMEMTPYTVDNDAKDNKRSLHQKIYYNLIILWLFVGRLLFFISNFLILREIYKFGLKNSSWLIMLLIPSALYTIPYIIGINYERHISPFLLMYVVFFFFLISRKKSNRI